MADFSAYYYLNAIKMGNIKKVYRNDILNL